MHYKELFLTLSRNGLLTIYKTFVRTNLDYADIIYGKPLTESFKNKLEMNQYNADLAINSALKVHRVTLFTGGSV